MKINEAIETILSQVQESKPQSKKDKFKATSIMQMPESTPLKSVKNEDLEKAMSEKLPSKAISHLISNSPIGMTLPTKNELADIGYLQSSFDMNGNTHYNNGLSIYTHADMEEQGAYYKAVYKTERFEQTMFYDKNGNLVKGNFKIKDEVIGLTEAQYSVWKNEKGGYNYIN